MYMCNGECNWCNSKYFCDTSEVTVSIPDMHALKEQQWELIKYNISEEPFCITGKRTVHTAEIKSENFFVAIKKESESAPGWSERSNSLACINRFTGKEYHFYKKSGEDIYIDNFPSLDFLDWIEQMLKWAEEKSRHFHEI